jgi:acyl-CoA thioester hydrolase
MPITFNCQRPQTTENEETLPVRETNSSQSWFIYSHRVAYHETDAMGVVHHANHLKFFEEARVAWLRDRGLMEIHQPYGPYVFAVVKAETRYLKPARFDDQLEVWVQGHLEGARIVFRYALWSVTAQQMIADGETHLVPINEKFLPAKLPPAARDVFAREPWSEVWPPQA